MNEFEIHHNIKNEVVINLKSGSLKVFINEEGNLIIDCDGFYIKSSDVNNVPGGCIVELTFL
jgi:hypothetical protein